MFLQNTAMHKTSLDAHLRSSSLVTSRPHPNQNGNLSPHRFIALLAVNTAKAHACKKAGLRG